MSLYRCAEIRGLRALEKIKSTILLVFLPVFSVASMATYNQYETIDAPCLILYKIGEQKFCVILVDLIFSKALTRLIEESRIIYPSPFERKAVYRRIYFVVGVGMRFQGEMGIFDGCQQTDMAKDLFLIVEMKRN